MKGVGSWLSGRASSGVAASSQLMAVDEPAALADAMASVIHIMNDDIDRAEAGLATGTSPFHKLGRGLTLFLRATLGFEREIMEQTSVRLAEAGEAAYDHQARALRDPSTAHRSKVYSPGAEYALCHAEAQLMSAVIAVLSENLTESLKGFYKLRRAFSTLNEISDAESKYVQTHGRSTGLAVEGDEGDAGDFRDISTDPIDLFIHSGMSMCFGILKLLLSMVPPAFAKLLSLFSFRGDRAGGLRMLWASTEFTDDIYGALSGLIISTLHNVAIALCDIVTVDALPRARLKTLVHEKRRLFPESRLWLMEEARMFAVNRELEKAVAIMDRGSGSPLKQVEALRVFERSLSYMYLHRYEECAQSFMECITLNSWSHALYYYIAGACYVELYRTHKTSDPSLAQAHAAKAEKYFREVPLHIGQKRFMGRQLPFDVFVSRKIAKWDNRAKVRNCQLVDAVGVSPVTEVTYFWSGFTKMDASLLRTCLDRLEHSPAVGEEDEAADEKAILNVLRGTCLRFLGAIDEAKSVLSHGVTSLSLAEVKGCDYPDTWPLPVAHYEMSVCLWQEAGGQDGNKSTLQRCSGELAKVERWESFELEARVGLKVTTARETLRRCAIDHP